MTREPNALRHSAYPHRLTRRNLVGAAIPSLVAAIVFSVACSSPEPEPAPDIAATVAAAVAAAQPTATPPPPDIDATVKAGVQKAVEATSVAAATPSEVEVPKTGDVERAVVIASTPQSDTAEAVSQKSEPTQFPTTPTSTPVPPTPTSTPVPPTPTPTPVPKPPGFLHGEEHGIALVQTDRQPSATRDGWVDIRMFLAATKFGPNPALAKTIELEITSDSICFLTSRLPNDCGSIFWGSQEQFTAEFNHPRVLTFSGGSATNLIFLRFEVAQNASKASLLFGDHKTPVDLDGTFKPPKPLDDPLPAPAPLGTEDAASVAGYFMGNTYGIAIDGVSSSAWGRLLVSVELDLWVMLSTFEVHEAAPTTLVASKDHNVCFETKTTSECIQVYWGDDNQFRARIETPNLGPVPRLRGSPTPVKIEFDVPMDATDAVLVFGDHRIPIDTRGMVGARPNYEPGSFYPQLANDLDVHLSEQKVITLSKIRHNTLHDGSISLLFNVQNNSEASDFAPSIQAMVSRVATNGKADDSQFGFLQTIGKTLGPGQNIDELELKIPRVIGPGMKSLHYAKNALDRPDAAILEFAFVDEITGLTEKMKPVRLNYERTDDEGRFFENLFDAAVGVELWQFQTEDIWGPIGVRTESTVVGEVVYVGTSNGEDYGGTNFMHALDRYTGLEIWRFEYESDFELPVVVENGLIFAASESTVHTLDASTGVQVWSTGESWSSEGWSDITSLAVQDGTVYVGGGYDVGVVIALDSDDGSVLWESRMGSSVTALALGSPLGVPYSYLYATLSDGSVRALRAQTGAEWTGFESGCGGRLVASDGVLFVSSGSEFCALNARTGEKIWSVGLEGDSGAPMIWNGTVFVASASIWESEKVYALDARTGSELWRFSKDEFRGDDVLIDVRDNVVYAIFDDVVYALDAHQGDEIWRFDGSGNAGSVSNGTIFSTGGRIIKAISAYIP